MWHPLWWSCLVTSDSVTSMGCNLPGSSVHGISQERILEWVAISFSRGPSQPRDRIHISCIGRQILHHQATGKPGDLVSCVENLLEIRWLFPGVPLLNILAHLILRLKAWWNVCLCYCFHFLYAGISEKENKCFPSVTRMERGNHGGTNFLEQVSPPYKCENFPLQF